MENIVQNSIHLDLYLHVAGDCQFTHFSTKNSIIDYMLQNLRCKMKSIEMKGFFSLGIRFRKGQCYLTPLMVQH